jgi:predicted regulator of Ras-like GTPase activity (Roadblock/LC7/MglB family)
MSSPKITKQIEHFELLIADGNIQGFLIFGDDARAYESHMPIEIDLERWAAYALGLLSLSENTTRACRRGFFDTLYLYIDKSYVIVIPLEDEIRIGALILMLKPPKLSLPIALRL